MSEEEKRQMEEKRVEEEKKKRPLIPKSAIMRLLAELVKSYTSCAQIVTQHAFIAGQSEIVSEVWLMIPQNTDYVIHKIIIMLISESPVMSKPTSICQNPSC